MSESKCRWSRLRWCCGLLALCCSPWSSMHPYFPWSCALLASTKVMFPCFFLTVLKAEFALQSLTPTPCFSLVSEFPRHPVCSVWLWRQQCPHRRQQCLCGHQTQTVCVIRPCLQHGISAAILHVCCTSVSIALWGSKYTHPEGILVWVCQRCKPLGPAFCVLLTPRFLL